MPPLPPSLRAAPFLGLLFILPFIGTTAFRLFCLLGVLIVTAMEWRRIQLPPSSILRPYLAWGLLALTASILSTESSLSIREFKNEIGYTTIALIGFLGFVREERDLDLALKALIASALGMVALAVVSKLQGGPWPMDAHHGGVGDYSSFFVYVAPLLAWWVWQTGRIWVYVVAAPIGGLMLVSVMWTDNRMAIISFSIELMVLAGLLLSGKWRRLYLLSIAFLAVGILFGTTSLSPLKTAGAADAWAHFEQAIHEDPRWEIWQCATSRIASSPWMGAGFGRHLAAQALADHCDAAWTGAYHAHNVFLDAGVQLGVPGMIVLGWLFFALGQRFWRYYQSPEPRIRAVGVVGLGFLIGLITKNQTDDFLIRHHSLLLWAIVGLLIGYGERLSDPDSRPA